jgi:hypothetical protein
MIALPQDHPLLAKDRLHGVMGWTPPDGIDVPR